MRMMITVFIIRIQNQNITLMPMTLKIQLTLMELNTGHIKCILMKLAFMKKT